MPAEGCRSDVLEPCGQVVAEGAGRGGTSAGRGGARGTHCGHRGPLGAVAQPLAAERHLTWCRAAAILAGHGGRLRLSFLGFPAIQKRLLQAIDHMRGLNSQSGSRRGQSEVTLSRMDMPWAGHSGVRAAAAVAGQGGLPATSAKDKSWRAMSSGPGEPSRIGRHLATPLAPSRPHGQSRHAIGRAHEIPGAGKGLKY